MFYSDLDTSILFEEMFGSSFDDESVDGLNSSSSFLTSLADLDDEGTRFL